MCSIAAQRIAEIGKAIDDLASNGEAGAGSTPQGTDPIVARVAELWTLLAELDPEVARRLVGYQKLSAPTDPGDGPATDCTNAGQPADDRNLAIRPPVEGLPCAACPQGRPVHVTASPGGPTGRRRRSVADDFDLKHGADVRVQPHRHLVGPDGLDRVTDLDLAPVKLWTACSLDRRRDIRRRH